MFYKKNYKSSLLFLLVLILFGFASCEKDYSYEGGITRILPPDSLIDSIPVKDSVSHILPEFSPCVFCNNSIPLKESAWTFKIDTTILCGSVDTAIVLGSRGTFTFFGPTSCVKDSGIIFTIYLSPYELNRDTTNYAVPKVSFYYYHTLAPFILINQPTGTFHFVIASYVHATHIATGTFSGVAYRPDGRAVTISDGKFNIKLN